MTINSDQKSCKSELFSGGKRMFEVGRWVRTYFENCAFGCGNVLKIGRLGAKIFSKLDVCEHNLKMGRLAAEIF